MTSLKKTKLSKEEVRKVPKEPGVYIFWNSEKKPIYVGKSVSLKSRVSSYLNFPLEPKTKKMISLAKYFSTIRVGSELEALLLEAKLVRNFDPQYNIQLKDDKNPLYIIIKKSTYPTVTTARKLETDKKKTKLKAFYGPFPSSKNVKDVLKMIRRIIPFSQHEPGKRPCLYSQIGLCDPCPSRMELETDRLKKELMQKNYRKNISDIKKILDGKLDSLKKSFERKMLILSKEEKFEEAKELRTKIERLNYITQPITNPFEFIQNPNLLTDIHAKETKDLVLFLKDIFPKLSTLSRIECYDVAHLAGVGSTASMVTFIEAEPSKNLYRRFKIYQKKGNDDYASLKEVAKRRLKHIGDWGKPDLIVVDGGKGQVKTFFDVFNSMGIPVIGLAKRIETVVVPFSDYSDGFWEKRPVDRPALFLLQRLRNESHRFARVYHHKLLEFELFNSKDKKLERKRK